MPRKSKAEALPGSLLEELNCSPQELSYVRNAALSGEARLIGAAARRSGFRISHNKLPSWIRRILSKR